MRDTREILPLGLGAEQEHAPFSYRPLQHDSVHAARHAGSRMRAIPFLWQFRERRVRGIKVYRRGRRLARRTCRCGPFESPRKQWHIEYGDDRYKHGQYSAHNPLRTRTRTLQERELSLTGIHFSANIILRECHNIKASSKVPWERLEPPNNFLL